MPIKLIQIIFMLGGVALASCAWPAESQAMSHEQSLAECQNAVDAAAVRLLPGAGRIAAERGVTLSALAIRAVPALYARSHGEHARIGDKLAGEFDVETNTIRIALIACQSGRIDQVLAHELGHALDYAATNRYHARGEAVLMPQGMPPLSKEDAADYYGNLMLSRLTEADRASRIAAYGR